MGLLTADMKRVVEEQRLGFVATVCPDGTPNLSPKGTTAVWDDDHLVFANIRSPGTLANLRQNASVEVNVVDPFLRKGYRFKGVASVLESGALYDKVIAFYKERGAGERHPRGRHGARSKRAADRFAGLRSRPHRRRGSRSVGTSLASASRGARRLRQQASNLPTEQSFSASMMAERALMYSEVAHRVGVVVAAATKKTKMLGGRRILCGRSFDWPQWQRCCCCYNLASARRNPPVGPPDPAGRRRDQTAYYRRRHRASEERVHLCRRRRQDGSAIRERAARKESDVITGSRAFADALTTQLQGVSKDKHLRVLFNAEGFPERRAPTAEERGADARRRAPRQLWLPACRTSGRQRRLHRSTRLQRLPRCGTHCHRSNELRSRNRGADLRPPRQRRRVAGNDRSAFELSVRRCRALERLLHPRT